MKVTARFAAITRTTLLAAVTPLLEKNVTKTFAIDVPVVFSMARLIVLAFATAMLRQIWHAGIAGWPEATLSIAIVLALPILAALERLNASDVLGFATTLASRFGIGDSRKIASAYGAEPSKFDDHRNDSSNAVG